MARPSLSAGARGVQTELNRRFNSVLFCRGKLGKRNQPTQPQHLKRKEDTRQISCSPSTKKKEIKGPSATASYDLARCGSSISSATPLVFAGGNGGGGGGPISTTPAQPPATENHTQREPYDQTKYALPNGAQTSSTTLYRMYKHTPARGIVL